MAKGRGRKRTSDLYFGPLEENAVFRFLESDDQAERNQIYNTFLKEPLNKMIESIIRRYKLYRKSVSFEELHADTLSFLMTKANKFEEGKGKKAYSYYGTICKNYILGLLIKDDKKLKQLTSFEDIYLNDDDEDSEKNFDLVDSESTTESMYNLSSLIQRISNEIKNELKKDEVHEHKIMNENERKLGFALVDILDNWESIFKDMEGGKKYNKISILASIRENTNLTTKDIRCALKRYKKLYESIKNKFLENGIL